MAAPLILRIISDVSQTLRANESVISSNTLVGKSALEMGADIAKSSKAAVISAVRMEEALKVQAAEYRTLSRDASLSSEQQAKAAQFAELSQAKLARSQGLVIAGMRGTSAGAKTAERDFSKLTRGALAGSGVISSLGRSLAFASGGFIAVAGTATLLHNAIADALSYESTQKQVEQQLKTSGLAFATYQGQIENALTAESRLSGFTRQDLLQSFGYLVRVSGNVTKSLGLDAVAADVARGRHIALSSASLALAKALGGSGTALRRLGIIIPKTLHGMDAINYVAKKFAGQAEAGATSADHLHASLATASETIGTALLPTFNRLVTEFSDWITKMEQSGTLQRDAETAFHDLGDVLHLVGDLIRDVDKVTGSFKNTVAVLIGLEFVSKINKWTGGLSKLIGTGGVEGGGMVGADAAAVGLLGRMTALAAIGEIFIPVVISATIIHSDVYKDVQSSLSKQLGPFKDLSYNIVQVFQDQIARANRIVKYFTPGNTNPSNPVGIPVSGPQLPNAIQDALSRFMPQAPTKDTGPFAGLKKYQQYVKKFTLSFTLLIEQAEAGLTASTADDVVVAKKIIAMVKSLRQQGRLHGQALIDAIALEAQAIGVLQSVAATNAQKVADAAQKASDALTASIDPIALELQLSKDTALGRNLLPDLKRLRAAAQKVIDSGKGTLDQQNQAWQQIIAVNQQIKDASAKQFTEPMKLQIQLARAEAFGGDTTDVLKRMKSAALKALHSGKYAGQGLIDLLNEIASINSQLDSSVTGAYGDYKKASVKALTAKLGLSADQRRRLEQRLSQRGPGGTVPATGAGAAGYVIDPATGRPVLVGHRGHTSTYTPSRFGGGGAVPEIKNVIDLTVNIDGHQVEATVTKQQQRRRRHNPTQTRGPNAATSVV